MKRVFTIGLVATISLLSLTGCGDDKAETANPLKGYNEQIEKAQQTKDTVDKQTDEINELN
jgi:hypothetical protein